MGWMEILAALQKAVPLLTRAVPMLEVFVASRSNTAANDEMKASLAQLHAAVRDELSSATHGHQELTDAVAANTERLAHISADLARLRSTADEQATRLASTEAKVRSLAGVLRLVVLLLCVVAVLAVVLVWLSLTRHG